MKNKHIGVKLDTTFRLAGAPSLSDHSIHRINTILLDVVRQRQFSLNYKKNKNYIFSNCVGLT